MASDDELREAEIRGRRADYESVFCTPAGQRVLSDLFSRFGGSSWYAAPPEQHMLAWMGGERNVVNYVLEVLGRRSDPSKWNAVADDAADHSSRR